MFRDAVLSYAAYRVLALIVAGRVAQLPLTFLVMVT
jgi:hypothetical protein